MKAVKPLYGIDESGLDWYLTYLAHLEVLGMKRIRADPCVLTQHKEKQLTGLVLLQVDDTLGIGTQRVLKIEETASKVFRRKQRVPIAPTPTTFTT